MKKVLALVLTLAIATLALVGCGFDPSVKSEGVMTHAEYVAAEKDSQVTFEAFVQGKQSWWDNKATIYLQDGTGGYLAYNASCTETEYDKLAVGTKVKFTGTKTEWKGLVELKEGATFEIIGGDTYVAESIDVTSLLGTEAIKDKQNMKVSFKNMKIETKVDKNGNECAFFYNWDNSGEEGSDSDLYFDASVNGKTYTFVIEYYLCGPDTAVYKAVQALKAGDTVDMEGFLYWYEGVQPHITNVTVK